MRTHHDHTPLGILLFQTSVPRTAGEEACSTMAPVALPLPVAEDASALKASLLAAAVVAGFAHWVVLTCHAVAYMMISLTSGVLCIYLLPS